MDVHTPKRSLARVIGKAMLLAPLLALLTACGGDGGGGRNPTGSTGVACVWGTHSWGQCDWSN
jgi:hypothetical protein